MAAAVSSMENGMSASSRSTQQEQPQHQHQRRHTAGANGFRQAPAGRPIRPRLSSSRSSSSSSSSRLSSRASSARRAPSHFRSGSSSFIPSAARVGGIGPSSSSFSSSSSSSLGTRASRGAAGGLWASIMWLGAAALPASLAPPSSGGVGASASASASSPASGRGGNTRRGTAAARIRNLSSSSSSSLSSSSLSQPPPSSLSEATSSPARGAPGHSGLAVVASGGDRGGAGGGGAPVRLLLPPPLPIGGRGAGVRAEAVDRSASGGGERDVGEEAAAAAPVSGSGIGKACSPENHVFLEGSTAVYTCSMCRVHLATRDHVVSECFHGHGGRAFLFERCVNVSAGVPEDRLLMTGMHVVADISCRRCGAELGWKYEEAAEKSQKYKEGKFILERCAVTLEGRSGDSFHGSSSKSNGRYGAERWGSRSNRSVIGWGADNSDSSDRW